MTTEPGVHGVQGLKVVVPCRYSSLKVLVLGEGRKRGFSYIRIGADMA